MRVAVRGYPWYSFDTMAAKRKSARDAEVRSFRIVVKQEGGWWIALVRGAPRLSGAVGQGRTRAAAKQNVESAISDISPGSARQLLRVACEDRDR